MSVAAAVGPVFICNVMMRLLVSSKAASSVFMVLSSSMVCSSDSVQDAKNISLATENNLDGKRELTC